MDKSKAIAVFCLVGFFGDVLLQLMVKKGGKDWGLKGYFEQHGSVESLFIAAGMMSLFAVIYIYLLKLPLKWEYLIIYGIVLDLIFRVFMIFPSLKGYYSHLNYFWSAVWGAIPMLLPLMILNGART